MKARNLAKSPWISVTTSSTKEAVIVEGIAEVVPDPPAHVLGAYAAKYPMGVPAGEPVYRVTPMVAFGFIDEADRFTATATRWHAG